MLLLRIPQEMAQLAAVEGGLEGAREWAHARRGVVVRIDVILDQELPPFFVRTLPDPLIPLRLPQDASRHPEAGRNHGPGAGRLAWA